ncbi:MAG TPA: serine/threonine-protein kinase [Labilithrix sp.]|nr:serine/threonine-protein kinase [Labilithrix sp.]
MDASLKRIVGDKYEVVGVLGEGGTGIVYDALRTSDATPVALKVMHAALAGDAQIRGRFRREATILRRLEGAHVCPILDFGEVPGETPGTTLLYIALRKIDGESLANVLANASLIEAERARAIMLAVLEGLASAHAEGVIHRDLKPANVLLDKNDDVVVVDFGMSKIVTGAGIGTTNLTTHNMVFGTPEYMSPEQARGDELDVRCDIYAAGIMLYEMLTGTLPFSGPTPLSVLTAHLTSDLEPPSKRTNVTGRITPALEAVVLHALARDRDERYGSARELAAALKHAHAAPDDIAAVHPARFSASPPGTDAFAETVPGNLAELAAAGSSPTLISERTLLTPAPRPGTTHQSEDPDSTVRVPSQRPLAPARTTGAWIAIWVIVAFGSICAGVYFALRH